ncbi:MAG: 2-oxo acid dehydrogenase subunit E2 [Steroidobacteraceae bacterium]
MAERILVTVPDLGDFDQVEVIEVLVAVGDAVDLETPLVTLETDKATMDVPSSAAGKVVEVLVSRGSRVAKGDPLVAVEGSAQPAVASPVKAPPPKPAPTPETPPAPAAPPPSRPTARVETPSGTLPPIEEAGFARAYASPSIRRLARELGVDLGRLRGSGAKGRITVEDVKAYVKSVMEGRVSTGSALPSVPTVDFAAFGPIEIQPLTRIQRISGPRLHASWVNVPHVTQHEEADITALEALRASLKGEAARREVKLTPLSFLMRACALVLKEFPRFAASLDPSGQNLVMKGYVHIGFAADTPGGLVVPVMRDVDRKGVYEIAAELGELSARAREGKLQAAQMQGACFTLSSLGGIGGTAFTPIINAPEVAILGISRARVAPVWDGQAFQPRTLLPLSLSYDHRVIDGAAAARFVVALAGRLARPESLIEAGE